MDTTLPLLANTSLTDPSPSFLRVDVSGVVYIIFRDPEKACYGAFNPLFAVMQHAQSAMRSAIGEMELDEIFHNR